MPRHGKRTILGELKNENSSSTSNSIIMEYEEEANAVIDSYTAADSTEDRIRLYYEQETVSDVDDPDDPDDPNEQNCKVTTSTASTSPSKHKTCTSWYVLRKDPFVLKCEWKDCNFVTNVVDKLNEHVGSHIPSLDVRHCEEEGVAVYVCLWTNCDAEMLTSDEAIRHVYYHAVHTKIKSIGARLMHDENHPKCLLDKCDLNLIVDLPDPFACQWDCCDIVLQNPQKFYYHVQAHAVSHLSSTKHGNKSVAPCLWRGCRSTPRGLQKMVIHLSSHTKEKFVGCPICGGTFASKTKFFDHCSRQTPKDQNAYQCSHCARSYSTERLLRDHMRNHINSYKCPFCDMTSPTPSSLSLHIRNRHISDRPFKCEYCDYRTQTNHNLLIHMSVHYSNALHRCTVEDCDFACRTLVTLHKHVRKEHGDGISNIYCCHLCHVRKAKGAQLSKHLIDIHNFRLPSGHSRFRYKSDSEGLYHLETVRYECIDATQEGQNQSQRPPTIVYVSETEPSSIATSTPVCIAYQTLDNDGKLVSQLVGGQALNVPVVQTLNTEALDESVVILQDNALTSSTKK